MVVERGRGRSFCYARCFAVPQTPLSLSRSAHVQEVYGEESRHDEAGDEDRDQGKFNRSRLESIEYAARRPDEIASVAAC